MSGQRSYHAGRVAEDQVAARYAHLGADVCARRWRGRSGEIDLIARDGAQVIFIEVKQSRSHARAAESLSARQMARICASASEFLGGSLQGKTRSVALIWRWWMRWGGSRSWKTLSPPDCLHLSC